MLKQEFLTLTGFTETVISDEQYWKIEAAYMNSDETKQEFCQRFYSLYRETVGKAIENAIHKTSLADKEQYLAGNNNELQLQLDKIHAQKMNLLIKLIA